MFCPAAPFFRMRRRFYRSPAAKAGSLSVVLFPTAKPPSVADGGFVRRCAKEALCEGVRRVKRLFRISGGLRFFGLRRFAARPLRKDHMLCEYCGG